MKAIYKSDSLNLSLYKLPTSIIFNDDKIKTKLVEELADNDFEVINNTVLKLNISVREYLKVYDFNMSYVPYFKLENYMSKKISFLDYETLIYIKLIGFLSHKENVFIFDDILSFLSDERKERILKYINENDIMYVNITSDIEETLFSQYLIVIGEKGVLIEGEVKKVLMEEKLLKKLGFNLPFVLDLSLQLKAYEVIDQEYYDLDKLVNDLWN